MRNPFKKKDPFAAQLKDGLFRGVAMRQRRRPFRFLRRRWVAVSLGVLLVLGAAGGYGAYLYFEAQGDVQDPGIPVHVVAPMEPFNALLVGSDSRLNLTEQEQQSLGADDVDAEGDPLEGENADTLILAHVDPETNHVTMVQFPRDLYVPISGGGRGKISSALSLGRPALVATIELLTGVEINKYAQVNLAGFRDLVDAIGGVEVCIPEPIPFDPATGIEVKPEEVGMVEFDGDRALRFVRSRKVFASGDFGRIQNQQRFLAAAIGKMTSPTTLLKLGTIKRLLEVAGENIRTDGKTTIKGLYDLTKRFRAFDPANYEAYTAPTEGPARNEAGDVLLPDSTSMKVMFEALDANESPAEADGVPNIDVRTVMVGVYNGIGRPGLASRSSKKLRRAMTLPYGSVEVVEVGDAPRKRYKKTVVRYDPEEPQAKAKAQLVAAALPGAVLQQGETPTLIDVSVIVGRAPFRTEEIVQIKPLPLPEPGALPAVCR